MPRLFIATPINIDNNSQLYAEYEFLCKYNPLLKTVSPENYHITLKFFGECNDELFEKIKTEFNKITAPGKIIPLTLYGIGVFPNIKKPSVIWTGIKTDEPAINLLHKNIKKFAVGFGFENENREFRPHLTLARVRKGKIISNELQNYITAKKESIFGESAFKRVVLFSSLLTPKGPVYNEIKSIHFKGQGKAPLINQY